MTYSGKAHYLRVAIVAMVTLVAELGWLMFWNGWTWHRVSAAVTFVLAATWLVLIFRTLPNGARAVSVALLVSAPLLAANAWLLVLFRSCAAGACL